MNDELIGKYLAGEASPEEATALEEWLEQSPDNRASFQRLSKLWYAAAGSKGHVLPDKQQMLQEIQQQLPAMPKSFRIRWYNFAIVGAVVVAAIVLFPRNKTKTDEPIATSALLNTNETIQRHNAQDGSTITLNSHSSFNAKGVKEQELLEGQVFLTTPTNGTMITKAGELTIEARDAAFSISKTKTSDDVIIWGNKGTVIVHAPGSSQTVTPGSKLIYHASNGKWDRDTTYASNETAFATRIFNFQDERLEDIMQQIGKAYEVKIRFDNPQLKDCRMSGSFEDQSLDYVMDIIATTLQIKCSVQKNEVVISGKACE
jgi:transmembrane sensor